MDGFSIRAWQRLRRMIVSMASIGASDRSKNRHHPLASERNWPAYGASVCRSQRIGIDHEVSPSGQCERRSGKTESGQVV